MVSMKKLSGVSSSVGRLSRERVSKVMTITLYTLTSVYKDSLYCSLHILLGADMKKVSFPLLS